MEEYLSQSANSTHIPNRPDIGPDGSYHEYQVDPPSNEELEVTDDSVQREIKRTNDRATLAFLAFYSAALLAPPLAFRAMKIDDYFISNYIGFMVIIGMICTFGYIPLDLLDKHLKNKDKKLNSENKTVQVEQPLTINAVLELANTRNDQTDLTLLQEAQRKLEQ